jgi:hypothetical protein
MHKKFTGAKSDLRVSLTAERQVALPMGTIVDLNEARLVPKYGVF